VKQCRRGLDSDERIEDDGVVCGGDSVVKRFDDKALDHRSYS
jgi:hypothetical protein